MRGRILDFGPIAAYAGSTVGTISTKPAETMQNAPTIPVRRFVSSRANKDRNSEQTVREQSPGDERGMAQPFSAGNPPRFSTAVRTPQRPLPSKFAVFG